MEGITREEHNEFVKRVEDENHRQNRRLEKVEDLVVKVGDIAASVEKMAMSMQSMVSEQERQGKRLEKLESRDGEMWRKAVGYVVTALLGAVIGFALKQIGF